MAGRYRLDSRIAGGGMGAVWLATDERLGRQVAVKQVVLPVGVSPEAAAEQRARTMREGRIAARITHPHAISVYDVVDDGGSPWLVMEHLPSRSLAAVLSADGVLPVQQVAQIGAQLADALVATHAAGIVHRDVKPGNVLVGEGDRLEGLVKITDFGISHATGDVRLTQTGMVTGTPAFLSPEVARGEEPGAAGDVWSLGATLFTALEGDPPFGSSGNSLEQLYRVAAGQFDPPVRSGALTPVLEWMLTPDPAGRPSMTEVRDALAAIAAGSDGDVTAVLTARTPLKPVPPPPRDPTRTDLPAAAPTAPRSAPLPPRTPPRTSVSATPARRRSRTPLVLAALVAVLLLVGGRDVARAAGHRRGDDGRPHHHRRDDHDRGAAPGRGTAHHGGADDQRTADHDGGADDRARRGHRRRGVAVRHRLLRPAARRPRHRLRPDRPDAAGGVQPGQLQVVLEALRRGRPRPGQRHRRVAGRHRAGHLRRGRRGAGRAAPVHPGRGPRRHPAHGPGHPALTGSGPGRHAGPDRCVSGPGTPAAPR
ncbi:MAG: protein kinase [Actinobacteria bacterium]|nr:protein kinase [Actinomycetota bacterium]